MTQPSFVPIVEADQVREAYRLNVPGIWTQSRPSELRNNKHPTGPSLGTPGPDQGFALKLARRFEDRLELAEGESVSCQRIVRKAPMTGDVGSWGSRASKGSRGDLGIERFR